MKKLVYFAIAALTLAACAKEIAPQNEIENNGPKVKVSFKAVLEQEDATKAEVNLSNGSTSWAKDDEIAVHTTNGKLVILKAESAGTTVQFSGTLDAGDAIDDNAIAYYPSSIAIANDDTHVNLPSSYGSAAEASKGILLRGVLSKADGIISFTHIGALLKVTVNDVPSEVNSLVFSTPNEVVTGTLSMNTATPPACVMGATGGSSITITTTSSERPTGATVFCIPLPTGTLEGGFTLELKKDDTSVASKTTTNDVAVGRAKIVKMKAFAPEGTASEWRVVGGFNGWDPSNGTVMTEVLGHDGWIVARNVNIAEQSGQNPGFKFIKGTDWTAENWGYGNVAALHTQYDANQNSDNNITYSNNGPFDIYFNPSSHKFFLANAGEPWYTGKVIYLMTDMTLTNQPYYLHVWPHSGSGLNSTWPGIEGDGTEVISGITYYKFPIAICDGNFAVNSYDCIFSDGKTPEENPTVRYQFENGALTTDAVNDVYYASFTSSKYNGYNSGSTDTMTQFTDPAQPQGESNWNLLVDRSTYKRMSWNDGPELIVKDVTIGSLTELMFRYTNGSHGSNIFYFHDGSVDANTDFKVDLNMNGSRSSGPVFTVASIADNTLCDVYLDVIKGTARVVPVADNSSTITLYFRLLDRVDNKEFLYAWQGDGTTWKNGDFPGEEMTYEKDGVIEYYKITMPALRFWGSSTKLIVANGSGEGHWQTDDFTSADWSGRKEAYYFNVSGNSITQLSGKPAAINVTIDKDFSDWDNASIPSKEYSGTITSFKAFSDGNKLFIYQKYDGTKLDLTGWNYSNLLVNADNDDTTGESSWLGAGRDCDLEYYYYKQDGGGVLNDFTKIYYKTYDNTNSTWTESTFDTSTVNWKIDIDSSNNIEIEMSIPIGQLGISSNSIARLGFIVRTPESTSQSNMLSVRIPKVTE